MATPIFITPHDRRHKVNVMLTGDQYDWLMGWVHKANEGIQPFTDERVDVDDAIRALVRQAMKEQP